MIRKNSLHIKQLFLNQSLASKFKLIYISLLLVCIVCNIAVVRFFYQREVQKTITSLSSQTLETISQNVDSSIQVISQTSTYLLGGGDIQNYLTSSTTSTDFAILTRNLRNTLYLALESMPSVSSIMIIRDSGIYESAARYTLPKTALPSPRLAEWHDEVCALQGAPTFVINGGNYLYNEENQNYLSLIRMINSTEDARPLGYMIINIPLNSLFVVSSGQESSCSDICVYSGDEIVLPFSSSTLTEHFTNITPDEMSSIRKFSIGREKYLMLNVQNSPLGLHYFSATAFAGNITEFRPFLLICLFTLLSSACMTLLIALCTKSFITAPLNRLTFSMKKTEKGDFHPACVTTHEDEIGQLQDAYNEMVEKIHELLEAKIYEQKQLRKAELNILQEQIKPHFLYNSLNGIAYLIKSRQNDTACGLLLSLSDYYRESLSKGRELIPLSSELNIVKNYLSLQKMRFQNLFEDEYSIQEETLAVTIPRLTLQPLVENALYHGILPTGEYGIIKICARLANDILEIQIQDDGIGMTEVQLFEILNGNLEYNQKSFGLRGTIERLQIYYNQKEIYRITSTPGKGTKIVLSLPYKNTEG